MSDISLKYIELYKEYANERFEKFEDYELPFSWDEFYKKNRDIYEEYLIDIENKIEKTGFYIKLLDNLDEFGFYIAFQNNDYEILNNVLYQTSRRKLLDAGITAGGTHCSVLENALSAFACNDFNIIESFFPKRLPYTKGTFYTENVVNIIKVLYFKENHLQKEVIEKAEKFLEKKITYWEKYMVSYFLSLVNRNKEEASRCLHELCSAYQKLGYPKEKLDKCFASEIHGLYRFAKKVDKDFFYKIDYPKHFCFYEKFEIWQKENNFPKGKLFYKYPKEMDYMNKIFNTELPFVELLKNGYANTDKFLNDLIENIK